MASFHRVNHTTQFGVISKFAEGALNSIVDVIDKDVKEPSLKTDPWGMPLITGLHLDIEPLMTTLCLWPFNQFFIHQVVHPSNPHPSNLEIRMWWGTMSKALLKSR